VARILSSPFGVGNSSFRIGAARGFVDTVPFGSFRKQVLEELGGYNQALLRNQDIELNHRIRSSGRRILLDPAIRCYYVSRPTISSFMQQNYHNGLWNVLTMAVTPGALGWRHFIPLAFVCGLSLSLLLTAIAWPWLLAAIALSYLPLLLLASVKAAHRLDEIPWILCGIPALHLSYGFGSLMGLLRYTSFAKRVRSATT
jgi:hypothetical protein